jgi:hypothetical protein
MADQPSTSQRLGKTEDIGIDANHDPTLVRLATQERLKIILDVIAQDVRRRNTPVSTGSDKMVLELGDVSIPLNSTRDSRLTK